MLNFNSLSKRDSTSILLSIESQLDMGSSVPISLKTLATIEKKNIKQVLNKTIYLIYEKNLEPAEALAKSGIINGVEKQILDKTQSIKTAILQIVELREMSKRFEKTIGGIIVFPIISVLIGLGLDYIMQPQFYEMYSSLIEQVKILKNIDLSNDIQLIWYLMDRNLLVKLMIAYSLSVVSILLFYIYMIKSKPEIVYKTIKLKSYDDIPLILFLVKSLKDAGLSTKKSLEILSNEQDFSQGTRQIYSKMLLYVNNNKPLYEAFEDIGFPKEVLIWLKTSEMSGTLWDKIEKIIEFVNKRNTQKLKLLDTIFKNPAIIMGFMIVIYFLIGIFMSTFVLQRIAMNLS